MLEARKKYKDILVYGDFEMVDEGNKKVFAYVRKSEKGEKLLVVCNFSPEKLEWKNEVEAGKKIVLSNYGRELKDLEGREVGLEAFEAFAVLV